MSEIVTTTPSVSEPKKVFCEKCGAEMMAGAKFCSRCGHKASVKSETFREANVAVQKTSRALFCEKCGHILREKANACPQCGTSTKYFRRRKRTKRIVAIVLITVLLLSAFIGVFAWKGASSYMNINEKFSPAYMNRDAKAIADLMSDDVLQAHKDSRNMNTSTLISHFESSIDNELDYYLDIYSWSWKTSDVVFNSFLEKDQLESISDYLDCNVLAAISLSQKVTLTRSSGNHTKTLYLNYTLVKTGMEWSLLDWDLSSSSYLDD